jgi:hypothetical protein
MSQVRLQHTPFQLVLLAPAIALSIAVTPTSVRSQGYDDAFEMRNKFKFELQYADYGEYEYPEPVIYQYGTSPYQQNQQYMANFPERRALLKFTRLIGERNQLGVRYQYSGIREDVEQHMAELKFTRSLSESVTGILAGQIQYDSRGFAGYQFGGGSLWEINALSTIQGDVQYFLRGANAEPVGGTMNTVNLRLKARQVVTLSTALQAEYIYYDAHGDLYTFHSHNISGWISQYLPSQTALHLSLRYYRNSMGISSIAPSVEIAQYLNWATTLWVKFRYYQNKSDNVSLGEKDVIIPDNLHSRAFSIQVNREMSAAWLLYVKYRYYASNLGVRMHTYMLGAVYAF